MVTDPLTMEGMRTKITRSACMPVLFFCLASQAMQVTVTQDHYDCNAFYSGYPGMDWTAQVTGGVPPYTFNWQNGAFIEVVGVSGTSNFFQPQPIGNNVSVTVTDNLGEIVQGTGYLGGYPGNWIQVTPLAYPPGNDPLFHAWIVCGAMNEGADCIASIIAHWNWVDYTIHAVYSDDETYQHVWFSAPMDIQQNTPAYLLLDSPDLPFWCPTDGNTFSVTAPTPLPQVMVLDAEGSCANAPTGSIVAAIVGPPWPAGAPVPSLRLTRTDGPFTPRWQSLTQPNSTVTFNQLPAGQYELVVLGIASAEAFHPDAVFVADTIAVSIGDQGGTCGTVRGRAFVDANQNCTLQTLEARVPQAIIEILPGPYYVLTGGNASHNYELVLPTGAYTMALSHPQVEEHCSGEPIPFNITGSPTPLTVDHPTLPTVPLDVCMSLSDGPARPGFEYHVVSKVRNLTPAVAGVGSSMTLTYDPLLTFLGSTPPPSSSSGNTLTWVYSGANSIGAWAERTAHVRFEVPPDVDLLGYELVTSATVVTVNTDGDLSNNTAGLQTVITGAYDPNDKLARTSTGSSTWWNPGEDQWIDYTIRFQNTGTDTAFNVLIIDTLPPQLDPASVYVHGASHPFQWMIKGEGILKFAFPGILLPDSNVNEPLSHGLVSFRIRVRDGFMTEAGDEVMNMAGIYFDFNPPIITEPCVLTVPYPEEQVLLDARVFLAGAYDTDSGLLRDDLRAQGLIPTSEPYTALGYPFQGGGGETVAPAVLATTGPAAIVDWVVVELRSAADPSAVGYSRAALLRRDGRVVDLDGTSPVAITAPSTSYVTGLRHRNHLPVVLGVDLFFDLAESEAATEVDFTLPDAPVYGTAAQQGMGGVMALWPGDATFDGIVKYVGAENDRDPILLTVGGNTPSNVVSGVYSNADHNMDGSLKYVGSDNDRDVILQTIGGTVPTATRIQQLP